MAEVTADDEVRWGAERVRAGGTVERDFVVERPSGAVPCVAWLPSVSPPWPLVLLGHGGSGHKRSERNVDFGQWFSGTAGMAALAIDGPYHGDRLDAPLSTAEYQQRMLDEGLDHVTDRINGDWMAAIRALSSLVSIDAGRLGYFGLSMGTRFGIPLAAALGDRLRCAVLGKFGLVAAAGFYADDDSTSGIADQAPAVSAPTMFHIQLDDQLFPYEGQLALFDLLGSEDKLVVAAPGVHADSPPSAVALWREFIAARLAPTASAPEPRPAGP